MKLEGRLGLLRDMILPCSCLCDIGTDHALIPAAAVMEGRSRRALATDIRPGPLERAARTLRRHRLEGRIELRLGPGLEPVLPGECDGMVIAGMGALMICGILTDGREKAEQASFLLLQPMHAQEKLRPWLRENGYIILDERLAREAGKRYQVLRVRHCSASAVSCEAKDHLGNPPDMSSGVVSADIPSVEMFSGKLPADPADPLYDCVGYGIIHAPDPLADLWVGDWIARQRRIVEWLKRSEKGKTEVETAEALLGSLENCLDVLTGKEPSK